MKRNAEPKSYLATWRNAEAEDAYRSLDDAAWDRATNSRPDAIDVNTSFGPTRVYRWPGPGPAVVFIHGVGDTAIRWIPYAERLDELDVYAIDVMGDVGRSTPKVGFTNFIADYATWLSETIDGLAVTQPHVVGESLGGYIALAYALRSGELAQAGNPQRVASTIALDPVGVVKLRLVRFMAWGLGTMIASISPDPVRIRLARRLRQPLLLDKAATQLYAKGSRGHPIQLPSLPEFTDNQLATISTPLRVLAAAKSAPFDGEAMVARIRATVPGAEAQLLADAGHSMSMSHMDETLAALRAAVSTSR